MNHLIIVICAVLVISTCTATKILYVLPDNVSDVNCPSQPCATLGQYLLANNGSLPVLSNVAYYFLPGEHHLYNNTLDIVRALMFSLIGSPFSPAKLVRQSQSHVSVCSSYNVTIRNLVFDQYSRDFYNRPRLNQNVTTALFLSECSYCIVEHVHFFGSGFEGINLVLNSYLNNITIDMIAVEPVCSPKFLLKYLNAKYNSTHVNDFIVINQLYISGYSEICYAQHGAMEINVSESYGIHIQVYNSHFHYMDKTALIIRMEYTDAIILVTNCTF